MNSIPVRHDSIGHYVMQLAGAEARCVLVETEVREEVSQEMAGLLRGMEASYKVNIPSSACPELLCGHRAHHQG